MAESAPRAVAIGDCFGWHHPRQGEANRLPVILCAPLGVEALASHIGWRDLAESLAAQGHDVLRLDYPGTGLSPGDWLAPHALARWEGSIARTIELVREGTGAARVILIGLRLGACLAARVAAARGDVEGVVALAPVVSGKRYARELTALAQMQGDAGKSPSGIAVYGFELPPALLADLGGIELKSLTTVAPAGLVAARSPAEEALAASWGFAAVPFEGFEAFTENPTHSVPPASVFAQVMSWCAARPDAPALTPLVLPAARFEDPQGTREEAIRFGAADNLHGVLFHKHPGEGRLGVIIANAGRNAAAGWGRQGFELATQTSRAGFPTLLFDLSGIGDSPRAPKAEGEPLYSTEHIRDVVAAARALKTRLIDKVVVIGACSGAYAAIHAASEIEGLAGVMLVNLLRFHWQPGESLDVVTAQTSFRPTDAYGRRLFQRETWGRLLRGEIAVMPIARTLLQRAARVLRRPASSLMDRLGLRIAREREAWRWLRALDQRRVRTVLVHCPEDPGVSEMTAYFGPDARDLKPLHHVSWHRIEGGDHSFSSVEGRAELSALLISEIRKLDQPPA